MKFKHLLLNAVSNGQLGSIDDYGITLTMQEFEKTFPDIKSQYVHALFPTITLESDQHDMNQNRFLYQIEKDVFRLHPDAIDNWHDQLNRATEIRPHALLN